MTKPTEPTCANCRWIDYVRVGTEMWAYCANENSQCGDEYVEPTNTCDHHEPAERRNNEQLAR